MFNQGPPVEVVAQDHELYPLPVVEVVGQGLALQKDLARNLLPLAFAHPLTHPAQNVLLGLLLKSQ